MRRRARPVARNLVVEVLRQIERPLRQAVVQALSYFTTREDVGPRYAIDLREDLAGDDVC